MHAVRKPSDGQAKQSKAEFTVAEQKTTLLPRSTHHASTRTSPSVCTHPSVESPRIYVHQLEETATYWCTAHVSLLLLSASSALMFALLFGALPRDTVIGEMP